MLIHQYLLEFNKVNTYIKICTLVQYNYYEIIKYLLETQYKEEIWITAAEFGNLDIIKYVIENNYINYLNICKIYILAYKNKHHHIEKYLVKN